MDKSEKKQSFHVSSERNKISLERVTQLLRQSYWASERSREMIEKSVENSRCYGVYDEAEDMVGFARIITDDTTTFYLMDVVIDAQYRGQGGGSMLMDAIMEDVGHLHGILHTDDAQEFYARYGFNCYEKGTDELMEKPRD